MVRLTDDMDNFNLGNGFNFSGVKLDKLGASSYTLVTSLVDVSGSVGPFAGLLKGLSITSLDACKKSPHSENIMLRYALFPQKYPDNGVLEIHGFKPVESIDSADYPDLRPGGSTPLYDAVYSGVASTLSYAKTLYDSGYTANAIIFIITDGFDNTSTVTPKMVADEIARIRKAEELDSLITILLGINISDQITKQRLEAFASEVGIDKFMDAGTATPQNVAKLAEFVSQSVSSTAQAQGTGGPSQNISPTI